MENRSSKARRNIIFGLGYRIISMVLPFFVRTAIIYIMGEKYVGISSLFASILQVLNMAELGFSSAIVYSMYKPIAEHEIEKVCALLNFYRKIYYAVGTVILVGGLILTPFIPKLINGSYPQDINIYYLYILYLANTVISYFLFAYKNALLTALQRNDLISKVQSVLVIVQSLIQLVLLFLLHNFYIYVLILICSTIATNLLIAYLSKKLFPEYSCRGTINTGEKKTIVKYVGGILIEKISDTSRNSFDSIVISAILGLTSVTIYSNYYYVYSSIYALLLIIVQSMAAGVGESIVQETTEKNLKDMYKFQFIYSWIVSWCSVCLCSLYQPFMQNWVGNQLMLSDFNMILFVVYFYVINMNNIRNMYFSGNGMWWKAKRYYLLEALFNLGLNIGLGYILGISGVLIATIVTVFVFNFLPRTIIVYKDYFEISPKVFLKQHTLYFAITIIVSAITFFVTRIIPDQGWGNFVCKVLVCIILPNILFLLIYYKNEFLGDMKQYIIGFIKHSN